MDFNQYLGKTVRVELDEGKREKMERLDKALDRLKVRFGTFAVQPAVLLKDRKLSGFDPKNDHIIHPVGYF